MKYLHAEWLALSRFSLAAYFPCLELSGIISLLVMAIKREKLRSVLTTIFCSTARLIS